MNNRKHQNSMIALATLGVYLGLLLAGGTPGVLAQQAALTKQFNVKDEVERKDDLDKKPDGEILNFANAIAEYFSDFTQLAEDFEKYSRDKAFDPNSERFEFERHVTTTCNDGYEPVFSGHFIERIKHSDLRRALSSSMYDFDDWETYSDCLNVDERNDHKLFRYKQVVSYDTSDLIVEISIPKSDFQDAEGFAERFTRALEIYEIVEKDKITQSAYQNTRIKSENNQVLVVTRLPRGSLQFGLIPEAE